MNTPTPPTTTQDTPERIASRKRIAAYMQLIHAELELLGEKPRTLGICISCNRVRLIDKKAA